MTSGLSSKTHCRNSRGFTLIEVLVSLTIMALITGIAFAGLRVGIDSWERGTRRIQELDRRVSVERLVGRQIPLASEGEFKGDSTTLQFISSYSLVNGPGDAMVVKYSFESGDLTYSETPLAKYTAGYADASVSQSLGGFANVSFGYAGKDPVANRVVWLPEWDNRTPPPVVRVEINNDVMILPIVNRQ
jgi:prepilin-type N-terminal cleavage/methylation domain-containing protein